MKEMFEPEAAALLAAPSTVERSELSSQSAGSVTERYQHRCENSDEAEAAES